MDKENQFQCLGKSCCVWLILPLLCTIRPSLVGCQNNVTMESKVVWEEIGVVLILANVIC